MEDKIRKNDKKWSYLGFEDTIICRKLRGKNGTIAGSPNLPKVVVFYEILFNKKKLLCGLGFAGIVFFRFVSDHVSLYCEAFKCFIKFFNCFQMFVFLLFVFIVFKAFFTVYYCFLKPFLILNKTKSKKRDGRTF